MSLSFGEGDGGQALDTPPSDVVCATCSRVRALPSHREGRPLALPAAVVALGATTMLSLCLGRYQLSAARVASTLASLLPVGSIHSRDPIASSIVIGSRLPRTLAATIVGASLSASGCAYQAVFRNPLVSPSIMGVLNGAALGAAIALVMHWQSASIQVTAFIGGLLAVLVGLGISKFVRGEGVMSLLLGGIVCNALFTSLLSLIKYVADPIDQLPSIVYWLLGSVAQVSLHNVGLLSIPAAACIATLVFAGRWMDVLALGDDEASSLGVPVHAIRLAVVGVATLLAALTVSLAGVVGWISLLVPHIARALVGPSNRRLVPLGAALGATVLVAADTAARTLSPGEIPLGILTEMFGAIGFVFVLRGLRFGDA